MGNSNQQETRIGSARDTLLLLLKSLPMGCYFNIYGFGSSYQHIFLLTVHRLGARTLIRSLEMDIENEVEQDEGVKQKVVELSVQSGVSSSFTAFIAVNKDDSEAIQGPLLRRNVPAPSECFQEHYLFPAQYGKPYVNKEVWATILALIWLHGFKSDVQDEWELLAMKAASWLCAQKAPCVTECVEAGNALLGCKVGWKTPAVYLPLRGNQAHEEYDDALSSGQQAFLLEESDQSPDIFSLSVGSLPPGESASIRLEYVTELAVQADDGLRFCLPAVLNPRYQPQGRKTRQHILLIHTITARNFIPTVTCLKVHQ
eukprot:superscaffoldBa00007210_g22324